MSTDRDEGEDAIVAYVQDTLREGGVTSADERDEHAVGVAKEAMDLVEARCREILAKRAGP